MDRADVVALNATMAERVLAMPAEPVPDGGFALRVLRTRGRRSGTPRSTPIGVIGHDGGEYLISPDTGRDWVRNLRADHRCTLLAAGETAERSAVEPGPDEATAAVVTYLRALDQPRALAAFPVAADAPADDVRDHIGSIAVFRLELA